MAKKNPTNLTVYLSYSLRVTQKEFNLAKSALEKLGFKVTHYVRGEIYKSDKLENADLVVFLTEDNYVHTRKNPVSTEYEFYIGKGQFSEAERCYELTKLAYVIHYSDDEDVYITQLCNRKPVLFNSLSWKSDYGSLFSFGKQADFKLRDLYEKPEDVISVKNNLNDTIPIYLL